MKKIGQIADAGIVGSALVKILQSYSKIERKQKAIEFVKELRGSANDLCEEEY
jgi:tryptophan synthase alpha subunit